MVEQGFNLKFYLFWGFKNRLPSRWWGAREGLEEADVKHVVESMQVTRQLHPIGYSTDSLHDWQGAKPLRGELAGQRGWQGEVLGGKEYLVTRLEGDIMAVLVAGWCTGGYSWQQLQ